MHQINDIKSARGKLKRIDDFFHTNKFLLKYNVYYSLRSTPTADQ